MLPLEELRREKVCRAWKSADFYAKTYHYTLPRSSEDGLGSHILWELPFIQNQVAGKTDHQFAKTMWKPLTRALRKLGFSTDNLQCSAASCMSTLKAAGVPYEDMYKVLSEYTIEPLATTIGYLILVCVIARERALKEASLKDGARKHLRFFLDAFLGGETATELQFLGLGPSGPATTVPLAGAVVDRDLIGKVVGVSMPELDTHTVAGKVHMADVLLELVGQGVLNGKGPVAVFRRMVAALAEQVELSRVNEAAWAACALRWLPDLRTRTQRRRRQSVEVKQEIMRTATQGPGLTGKRLMVAAQLYAGTANGGGGGDSGGGGGGDPGGSGPPPVGAQKKARVHQDLDWPVMFAYNCGIMESLEVNGNLHVALDGMKNAGEGVLRH